MLTPTISFADFEKVDIRLGEVVRVEAFPEARNPSYRLWIDFGPELGIKQSSAQIIKNQTKDDLLGRQVICVVNFAPKFIAGFKSEVLTLGVQDDTADLSNWVVLTPFKTARIGGRIK